MQPADLVLHNGNVITLDRSSRVAGGLAVRDHRIVAVGDSALVLQAAGPASQRIDLGGRSVLPGFFDAHPHMDREGLKAYGGVPLAGLASVGEIVEAVAAAVRQAAPGEWVVLMPMGTPPLDYVNDGSQLKEGRFPTRFDLDAVSPENPVYIRAVWGWWSTPPFPAVANSLALREAGITRDTPAPYKVEIVKDRRGEPLGVFLEENRTSVLEYTLFRKLPRFSHADRVKSVRLGSRLYSALGTTSGYEGHGLTPALIRAYREAHEAGELRVRMYTPLSIPSPAKSTEELKDLLYHWSATGGGRGSGDEQLRVGGITLDPGDPNVAAIIARDYPYEQWAGFFYQGLSDAEFVEIGVAAVQRSIRLNTILVNAPPVYDLERSLRLFEAIDRQASIRELRCVGIHLSDATDEQLRRIRDLGLVITMTPSFLHHHARAFQLDKLEDEAIPIRRVLDASIPVALGSDNVPPSMLFTTWEALARWDRARGRSIGRSQLSREEALRISVQSGHYLTWEESSRGAIEAGRIADFIVLDGDPLTCDLARLPHLRVDLTVVNGTIVHERDGAATTDGA